MNIFKMAFRPALILAFSFGVISFLSAQVVINEVSAANFAGGGTVDNFGDYEDWIELYNPGAAAANVGGFYLSDDEQEPMKWEIPAGTSIPSNAFLLVYASGRDELAGTLHTNFKISQGKQEAAVFANAAGTIIDSYVLTIPNQRNHSRGRSSDGAANWSVFTTPTPGLPNVGALQEYATVDIPTAAGYYTGTASVVMTSPNPGITIHYTTDGTEPTTASPVYAGAVALAQTTVVRAKAFSSNPLVPASFTQTNTYFVNETHTVPIVSVSGNDLLVLVNGSQIESVGHFEMFGPDGTLLAECGGDFNEHGNDSWAYPQRGIDYITQDEFGYGNEINYPVFPSKDRNGYQRLILKAAANDNYPFENGGAHIRDAYVHSLSQMADLRMDERTYEPCVMYVNGQYWGVYEIREKVDDLDFTDHYYDQGAGDVDFLKTWGGTWEEYGSGDDWDDLRDFILGNDMSDPANYDYVKGLYNTGSLIDYFTLNSYIVSSDWLNWNTGWWRGRNPDGDKKKWRYILWDMDATFDHYNNFTGIPDQSANADICDPAQIGDPGGQGHVPIWNALLDNDEFFADYINRYSDLSGSFFTCDFMHQHLDSLVDRIAPEMPAHFARWGGTMGEWEQNVQNIHDFIAIRCAVVNAGFIDCYPQLDGPYQITLMADPPQGGRIDLPSMEISNYPFTASYFGGVTVNFDADENPGYIFSHWTSNGTVFSPDEFSEEVSLNFTANDTLIAHFVAEVTYDLTLDIEPPNTGTITLDGTTYSNFPVTISATGSALSEATATAIGGWDFENWSPSFAINTAASASPTTFQLDSDGSLTANFYQVIYDVTFDVSPPGVADITINGDRYTEFAQTLTLPGNVALPIATRPTREFFIFDRWNVLSAAPSPDDMSIDIELNFQSPDQVVAYYTELPNFPLELSVYPEGAGWIKVPDTIVKAFPYTKNYLAQEKVAFRAIDRGVYEFDHWEINYGYPMDDMELADQNYLLAAPTGLVAHFKERFSTVFIPTAFSPNGDGINDIFKVRATEIDVEDFSIVVMNRWGQEMWSTTNVDQGWDGSNQGDDYYVRMGVYTYFIHYRDLISGEITEKAGTVVLVR